MGPCGGYGRQTAGVWDPEGGTVSRPPIETSLDLEGWRDVSPRGSITEEEYGDPILNDALCTNQLAINVQLLRMVLAGMDEKFKRLHSQLEAFSDALGGQIHDTDLKLGTNPGKFTSPEDSAWDGTATTQGTLGGME
jgi:hypothetical protein